VRDFMDASVEFFMNLKHGVLLLPFCLAKCSCMYAEIISSNENILPVLDLKEAGGTISAN